MPLEAKYQYTHFIYPFVIDEKKYTCFIKSLLDNENNWILNFDKYNADDQLYDFFLPYMKMFLFPTLQLSDEDIKNFKQLDSTKKAKMLSLTSCFSFNYNLLDMKSGHVMGKQYEAINFDISNIRLICFKPGICFFDIKAQVDTDKDIIEFNKILDFNHEFRLLTPKIIKNNFKKIKGNNIDNVEDIAIFIKSIISGYESKDINKIYYDKMFTYSYICVDEKYWTNDEDFQKIENDFYKLQYVMDGKNNTQFNKNCEGLYETTYSRWKYSIFGFSPESGVVMVSDKDKYNITRMPYDFEKTYMYMMFLALYQKISLINFSQELLKADRTMVSKLNKKLAEFTNYSWFSQITNSKHGNDIWQKWQQAFKLVPLYEEVHKEYIEYYNMVKEANQEKINLIFMLLYITSIIISGFSIQIMYTGQQEKWIYMIIMGLILLVACIYPVYLIARKIKYKIEKKSKGRRL